MTTIYLAGQTNFGNRGCEALVRSAVSTVSHAMPGTEFLVPSHDKARDAAQWPEAAAEPIRFVSAMGPPANLKWWNRLTSRLPAAKPLWEPRFGLPNGIAADVKSCDALLMIGGDNISLDYGYGSLFQWSGLSDAASRAGLKTMLFAASVGPFSADPVAERFMRNHLQRYHLITVRESASYQYVQQLGLTHAELVTDPAFALVPSPCDLPALFLAGRPVLGFNISPLIQHLLDRRGIDTDLVRQSAAFIERVVAQTDMAVALVPHVDPLDGSATNSDSNFMSGLLARLLANGVASDRVGMLGRGYNAAQLKHIIGQCRFFIGARTHATVAAWSTGVPTVSIAYSIKAKGLNQDLFGSLDHVLDTPAVNGDSLWDSLQTLRDREPDLRALLAERIPIWRARAHRSAALLAGVLR